jgi:UDP-GlcNAc:undecaprenyl-phosphate/decaprenyl-phosphate GlcNAc-1-phosphate transferase
MTYLLLFVTSAGITLALTPLARSLFHRMGWVDRPDHKRKLHRVPVPRLGGIPISIAFFCSIGMLSWLHGALATGFHKDSAEFYRVIMPSLLILAVGIWDDIYGASPYFKITVQIAAGYWLYSMGVSVHHIGVPGTAGISLGWAALPMTLLWVVGITNALNLVDGLDGLASGVAFFAATTMFVVATIQHNVTLEILTITLCGATLAFLRFNFNPATVFLGDSGSMFLGFLLATFSLLWSAKASTLVAVVAPLFALGLPIAEVGISMFRRFVRGQPIFGADRQHIHHQLLLRGMTPKKAVLILYGVCALLGICSLLLAAPWTRDVGLVLLVLVAAGWLGIQQLGYHEFGEVGQSLRRGLFQERQTINVHVRLRNLPAVFETISDWNDLMDTLRELGDELGFHEVTVDLESRPGRLPPGVLRRQTFRCVQSVADGSNRCWRVEIPIGQDGDDQSVIIFSRPVAAGTMPYVLFVLVDTLSSALPPVLNRVLQAEALPASTAPETVPQP